MGVYIGPQTAKVPPPSAHPKDPEKVSISVDEYVKLVVAARDLNILRDSYMCSAYGIDNTIARAIFGDKPDKGESRC